MYILTKKNRVSAVDGFIGFLPFTSYVMGFGHYLIKTEAIEIDI